MCSRCTFTVTVSDLGPVYECAHGTKHVCDSTCTLGVYSSTGATFACPISGIAKDSGSNVLEGIPVATDEFVEEKDCLPQVQNILMTVLPDIPEIDRFALSFEIARVREAYHKRAVASLVSHTLVILYQMKTDGWKCAGVQVIPRDELVSANLCDETELENLNGIVACSMKDITKGSTYITHALDRVNPLPQNRRAVSFVQQTKTIPPSMIVRPRAVVIQEIRAAFDQSKNRFKPADDEEFVISNKKRTRFTYE